MGWAALALVLAAPAPPPLRDLLAAAQRSFEASDRKAARRDLALAAEHYPASPVVHNFLGILDAEDGQPAAAEVQFREAVRLDPRYTDAYLNLGRLYQENAAGQAEAAGKALAVYEAILRYEPAHGEANFQAATLLRATGQPDRALERLQHMPPDDQRRPNARLLLGGLYEDQGSLERARATLDETAAAQPTVEMLLELARLASRQKDYPGALGYLAHARGLDPNNARVHFLFGMACVALDLGVEAFTALSEAARLAPDDPDINYTLGAVALHRRDASEAIPFLRKYAELRPGEPRAWLALGLAYFRSGDFAAARPELVKAAAQAPTSAAAHYFLARIAREENDLREALRLVDKAVEVFPGYADAHAERGLVLFRLRRFDEAEKALRRSLEIDGDNYLANLHLQMLYERNRDPRAAEQKTRVEALSRERDRKSDEFRRVIGVRPN